MKLDFQLGQKVDEARILVKTNLANDMMSGTAYNYGNIEIIAPKKSALTPFYLSSVAIEESLSSNAYIANSVETKGGNLNECYRKYMCATVYQRLIQPLSEAFPYMRSNVWGVQLSELHGNLVRTRQALVV